MSAASKSVLIIGAGLAGLAAGVYAQSNGYRSHIFEHASQPGGVAASWRRGQYLIDGGIHFLMQHRGGALRALYDELDTAAPTTVADMCDYGEYIDQASGRSLRVSADLEGFANDWAAQSPPDAAYAAELVTLARAFAQTDVMNSVGMGDPPELAGPFSTLKLGWEMRSQLRYFTGKYATPMARRGQGIRDPFLRQVYENLFFPEAPVWFVGMVLALLYSGQLGLLLEGSYGFVQPIADRFVALGGELTYNATVEEIVIDGDRASGVRLSDGALIRADAVISAADGQSTLFRMLGGRFVDDKWRARYRDWPLIRPMVMINYGVRRTFPGPGHIRMVSLDEPIRIGSQAVSLISLRLFNYSDRFAPPGHTVLQVSFDADWDFWSGLHGRNAEAYQTEKQRVAAEVLERLEALYPGIAGEVEVTDVATPYTTWRYTLNQRGAYEGWLPGSGMMMTPLPRTLKGLHGFYMAGQWVVPGGGVPTCLLSGRDAVRIMCARDGRSFHNSRTG